MLKSGFISEYLLSVGLDEIIELSKESVFSFLLVEYEFNLSEYLFEYESDKLLLSFIYIIIRTTNFRIS